MSFFMGCIFINCILYTYACCFLPYLYNLVATLTGYVDILLNLIVFLESIVQ